MFAHEQRNASAKARFAAMPSYYRAAHYLCAAVLLTDAIWLRIFVPSPEYIRSSIPLFATAITILGLLIYSNFIRYIGGVVMAFWAVALLWPLVSTGMAPFSRPAQARLDLAHGEPRLGGAAHGAAQMRYSVACRVKARSFCRLSVC